METKVCTGCGRELPVQSFAKRKASVDGLNQRCRECMSEYMKAYSKRKKDEKIAADRAEFEKKHKIYTNIELAKFTPRELMLELKARGYEGELVYVEHIVKEHRINLGKLD